MELIVIDRWEYLTIPFEANKGFWGGKLDMEYFTSTLNTYGKEGWEAISCFDTNYGQGTSRYVYVLLKRKLL